MGLNRDEKLIARKLFQLEIYKRNGQSFEDFFVRIMQMKNSEFTPVKPQGQYGDRKNDGFIKKLGEYYQIYSPEDPAIKEKDTISKLNSDFNGLRTYWQPISPIKKFHYVLNDKYKGAYPSLQAALADIETAHPHIECRSFLSHQLEDIFLSLPVECIEELVGRIVLPEEIKLFDSSVMNDVVKALLSSNVTENPTTFPEDPDFDKKISFNALSSTVETYLRFGSFQEGELKDYFRLNSTFAKSDLRNVFNNLYNKGLKEIPDVDNKPDLVFFYILDQAHPSKNNAIKNALCVLMSYFFSYCDIFEEPLQN